MKLKNSTFKRLFFIFAYFMITCTLAAQVTIVPFNSSWKYIDNGSDQGILWRLLSFSDLNWKSGKGVFGFGTKGLSTEINFGGDKKNKYITTYFRKSINIPNPSAYSYFSAKVKRGDDGVVVYVNGVEVFRNNMPSEAINYRTQGADKDKGKEKDKDKGKDKDKDDDDDNNGNGNKLQAFNIKSSAFKAGVNVIAVEIHLKRENSPSMSFDLELLGYHGSTPSDVVAPVVKSIDRQSPTTQNTTAGTLVYRTIFSEKVSGVDASDFNISTVSGTVSGTVNSVTAVGTDGTTYDVTVNSITGTGTIRLDLKPSGTGIKDAAGNAISSGFTGGQTYIIEKADQVAPVVQSINRQTPTTESTNATSVVFRATFSEKVSGVDISDFNASTVSGTVRGNVTGLAAVGTSRNIYDVTVSAITGTGVLRLDLKGSSTGIQDAAGNAIASGFTGGQSYTIGTSSGGGDVMAPVVQSISRYNPTTQSTTASSVVFRATFSEAVSGVGTSDFSLTKTNTATGNISAVSGTGATYDITVSSISGNGSIRLDLNSSGTGIQDAAGNTISGGFTSGESYTIVPKTIPVLTSVSIVSNNSNPSLARVGNVVTLSFTASEPINIPTVTIATHSVTAVAESGNSYTATYTMTAADAAGMVPFSINFSSTAGNAGTPVNATTNGSSVTFDKTAPAVTSINRQSPATETITATTVTFRATFSEKVSGVDAADFTATTVSGNVSSTVSGVTVVTEGTTYDVTVSSITGSGALRLDMKSSATGITDVAGNTISGGFTTGQIYNITPPGDVMAPTVVSINRYNPTTQNTTATSVVFRTTFSEAVTGVEVADFSLTKTNTATGNISSVSGSGTTYDITVNGISGSGSLRLDLNGSGTGITDAAGNAITSGYSAGQTYIFEQQTLPYGFTSVTPLSTLPITDATKDKPQAKAWKHAGKWWCVLATSSGVKIYRLDGTSWTSTLVVAPTTNARADCRVVGDLVHILLYKGASQNSFLATVQYDAASGIYKMWSGRSSNVTKVFPAGSETATLVVDSKGRMWTATDGVDQIIVRWSDAPYTNWSDPIVIASGIKDDDICTITALPGKIGVFWSNQNTQRFGFKTHTDGADPATWSADELPASQSALNIGYGMADDHMNIAVASDGTMYCAVKTGYNTNGYPAVSMLVRRPSGTWDGLYPVTLGGGTQPMVVLNEAKGKVKVVYTTVENGGEIVYRESSTSGISFGNPLTLISGGGYLYNYATSTHQTYDPEVVILATNVSTNPWQAVSVLASDGPLPVTPSIQPTTNQNTGIQAGEISASPNPFSTNTTLSFTLAEAGDYSIGLYDLNGALLSILKKGRAEAGVLNTVDVSAAGLIDGIYMVKLQTTRGTMLTYKLVLKR